MGTTVYNTLSKGTTICQYANTPIIMIICTEQTAYLKVTKYVIDLRLLDISQEFVTGLSVLSRGSLQEKLQWAFCLYDINGDGIITKDEMLDIVSAVYDLMGKFAEPSINEHTARDHVDRVFQVNVIVYTPPSRYAAADLKWPPPSSPISLYKAHQTPRRRYISVRRRRVIIGSAFFVEK